MQACLVSNGALRHSSQLATPSITSSYYCLAMGFTLAIVLVTAAAVAAEFTATKAVLPGANPLDMVVMANVATGEQAEIVYSSGGRLNRLLMRSSDGSLREVLMRTTDADVIRTNANHYRASMLVPWANRIRNGTFSFFGETHYLPRNEVNAYRQDALHGFIVNKSLSLVSLTGGSNMAEVVAEIVVGRQSWPGWPWAFRLVVTYQLDSRGLNVTTSMTNTMTDTGESLPFFHSMHPYVNVSQTAEAALRLGPCEQCGTPTGACSTWRQLDMGPLAPREGALIPTGITLPFTAFDGRKPVGGQAPNATYYDDEFTMIEARDACSHAGVTLTDPSYPGDAVTVWGDPHFRVFQVFTGAFTWGEQSIAIEPMSGAADAYNSGNGVTVLAAGQTTTDSMGVFFQATP